MVSTFTPNVQLEEPARGDQVNGWFAPVNTIMTTLDFCWGGTATITVSSQPLTLATSQFQCKTLTFSSTLTANITVTFPTSFIKSYEIQNLCTGTSAFTITLATTAAGGTVIGAPPGENVGMLANGSSLSYLTLHRIGDYWDHAGSSVPGWVGVCTNPPYINCDGTTFSSATYPQLANIIGTTLPDSRGRARWTLNQGTGRITAGISGVDGNTKFAAGGSESMQAHNHSINDPSHNHTHNFNLNNSNCLTFQHLSGGFVPPGAATINAAFTGITVNNNGSGGSQNMPPAYIGGVTMIRAG